MTITLFLLALLSFLLLGSIETQRELRTVFFPANRFQRRLLLRLTSGVSLTKLSVQEVVQLRRRGVLQEFSKFQLLPRL